MDGSIKQMLRRVNVGVLAPALFAVSSMSACAADGAATGVTDLVAPGAEVRKLAGGLGFTEGPVWDGSAGVLYFTDLKGKVLHRWSRAGGLTTLRDGVEHFVNGLALYPDGGLYACEVGAQRLIRIAPDGVESVLVDAVGGRALGHPNAELGAEAAAAEVAAVAPVDGVVQRPAGTEAFLDAHCYECHDDLSSKGDLDLTALPFELGRPETFRRWVKVHDKVAAGEMPPAKKPRPAAGEAAAFLGELSGALRSADLGRQAREGRGRVRRLNRVEFEAALSDLLEVPLHLSELLPPDAKAAGFDTVGAALNVSAVQVESYLEAIDAALDRATWRVERPQRRKWKLSYLQSHGPMQEYRRTGPTHPVPDGLAMFAPDFFSHFNSLLDTFVVAYPGRYRVRVSAYALRTEEPITLTVRMGGPGHKESDEVRKQLLGNVSVHPGAPQAFDFEASLDRGQMFRIYPSSLRPMRFEGKDWWQKQKDYRGPAVVVRWVEVDGPIFDQWPPPSHRRLYAGVPLEPVPGAEPNRDPNAHLDGPPTGTAKPRLTRLPKANRETGNRMVYDPKQGVGGEKIYPRARLRDPLRPTLRLASADAVADARRLLAAFLPRAFRRPVEPGEVRPFTALVERWLDAGVPFEDAMRAGYKAVLTSPGFLYHPGGWEAPVGGGDAVVDGHGEGDGGGVGDVRRLGTHGLAGRLAFFLWSSMPDDALLTAAGDGRLATPEGRRAQVERMLRDPRSGRFLEHFLGQWLDLRQIDFTSPDSDLYPEFDPLLQWSMVEETVAFFRHLLDEDLGVANVVDSDFALLNDRLAEHYGIPGVEGVSLRKVALPAGSPRGGVMTQGSVLKVTANGTTTSPVVRGVWLMERIMGEHPDPPPPGVPAIEPDIRGAVTVRQQLEQHRSEARCAGCHAKIDPPGVALENFDVIGGWRGTYRAVDPERQMGRIKYLPDAPPPHRYVEGLPVDAAYQMADGRGFRDVREFKQLLLTDPENIAYTVAEKLVTYATGAPPSFADRAEIEAIVERAGTSGHGFRSLLHEVVQSPLFELK